ncbi:hypothetical protein Sta7437_4848 (plasmid) [Stanieria cyanosphaera PCC 7437]|uniref:Uncharacterized protein n=1 Tax=Stanieria cyanosphaera (strain ATCC 29371 / PCC 7437) TaxID=111780 RepID=K9Y1J7_STAC7|nr:hypothetical protein [Stanieria cyanosphaera]AFZ38281.1 hypothetical protein Sta7437_4848 [Stanieria cyanosphaera PCC 7437]
MIEVNLREASIGNVFADLNIPKPSLNLTKGNLDSLNCDRLFKFLNLLGCDIKQTKFIKSTTFP